jgi:hypothetical protein
MKTNTQIQYAESISAHFEPFEIKNLCALIDQRIEQGLPYGILQRDLLSAMESLIGQMDPAQKKALEAVRVCRDDHRYNEMKPFLFCTHETGLHFTIDLNGELLFWDVTGFEASGSIEYGTTLFQGKLIRTISGIENILTTSSGQSIKSYFSPTIFRHNITECSDMEMLDKLFEISEAEIKLHLAKHCIDCGKRDAYPTCKEDDFYLEGGVFDGKRYETDHHVTQYQCGSCQEIFYK